MTGRMEENANLTVQAPQLLSMLMGKREKVIAIVGELALTFISGAGTHPFPGYPFRSGDVHDIPGYSHPAASRWTLPAGLQGKRISPGVAGVSCSIAATYQQDRPLLKDRFQQYP